MTIEIRCEVGKLLIGDRAVLPGSMLAVTLAELPIEISADAVTGDWRALLTHAGTANDPAINVAVMYGEALGERYSLTPAGVSRFGCSVVIEGELGDRVLISAAALPAGDVSPAA